ncbi:MAG TPA: hypothetical protein VF708_20040 [Pyrinomonadaceae bacterium]|jgi:hypothetical protein
MHFPLLRFVLVCHEVIEGEAGLPDAYGVLSEVTIASQPGEPQFFELSLDILVSIYTEDENETYQIDLAVKAPSGHEGGVGTIRLGNVDGRFVSTFAGPLDIEMDTPGTFWIKVYYHGRLLGEVPLKVNFLQALSDSEAVN